MTFPEGGGVIVQRNYTWEALARDTVQDLGNRDAFLLAGLCYVRGVEASANSLLQTSYGRIMLGLDPQTRRHYALCIMRERHSRLLQNTSVFADVPPWWLSAHPDLCSVVEHKEKES